MTDCASCGAPLESPLVCEACGVLADPSAQAGGDPSPFALFGLEPAWQVDREALRRRLLALTRRTHPDYFAADPAQRELAERASAALNEAHSVLEDDFRRADWLVRHLGGPDEQAERQMPQEFLMEVLEWNEALEAAREAQPGSPARELRPLRTELEAQRVECFEALSALLTPLPDQGAAALTEARRRLNAVRYLDRALTELAALALAQPAR